MSLRIAGAELREMLRAVSFAIAPGGSGRAMLEGVHLTATDGRLCVAATDGHRIARTSRPAGGRLAPFTVAFASIPTLYGACRTSGMVDLRVFNGRLGVFAPPDAPHPAVNLPHVASPKTYPNFEAVIPSSWAASVRVDVRLLVRDLYVIAAGHLSQNPGIIRLRRGDSGALEVWSEKGADLLRRVRSVSVTWPDGEWPDREVNALYLLDGITAAPGTLVEIRMNPEPTSAVGLFSPADPAWTCVTMPIGNFAVVLPTVGQPRSLH